MKIDQLIKIGQGRAPDDFTSFEEEVIGWWSGKAPLG